MKLMIVGLPLGNIEDISLRAIKKLAEAQIVICEDTRVFNKLWMKLANMGHLPARFEGKLVVLNDFNENEKYSQLADKISEYGDEVILVSDAGMPLVSDPGYKLLTELVSRGAQISVIPGPTAVMTALAVSGLPTDRLYFVGFLPKKQGKRDEIWAQAKLLSGATMAIYEAPSRVADTLSEIVAKFGSEVRVVVARELTKEHEEVRRGRVSDILSTLGEVRGEVVILLRLE